MYNNDNKSYYNIFAKKYMACKSKKDYRKLCKFMLKQFDVIDGVDEKQWQLFSSLIGTDTYIKILSLSLKMYMLEQQGIPYDIVSVEQELEGLDL